jgi:hypothetical protein
VIEAFGSSIAKGWGGEEMDDEHGKGLKALKESSSFCMV